MKNQTNRKPVNGWLALLALVFCGGCGTILSHGGPGSDSLAFMPKGVYGGVRFDGGGIISKYSDQPQWLRVFFLVDFPLSAAADTVALPFDLATLDTGSLKVTLVLSSRTLCVPAVAGRWRLDAGPWQISGATLTHLRVGNHAVTFSPVKGWQAPTRLDVDLAPLQLATNTGVYVPPLRLPARPTQ